MLQVEYWLAKGGEADMPKHKDRDHLINVADVIKCAIEGKDFKSEFVIPAEPEPLLRK